MKSKFNLFGYCFSVNPVHAPRREVPVGPDFCPITGRKFWGNWEHPERGTVALYGGPFDSYTIPEVCEDGELRSERYDQDEGDWVEGGQPEAWCYLDQQPEPPAAGMFTLFAPNGRRFTGETYFKAIRAYQNATIPAEVQMARIMAGVEAGANEDREIVAQVIRTVAELPGRDSPEWWPEAMLVTGEELQGILYEAFSITPPAVAPVQGQPEREAESSQMPPAASQGSVGHG